VEVQTDPLPVFPANKLLTAERVFSLQSPDSFRSVSALTYDLTETSGYVVADREGRILGRVECPMYGTQPDIPDALSVRGGFLSRRRRMVPAETIETVDGARGVIALRVGREAIRSFL
jgi:hypothetical protein